MCFSPLLLSPPGPARVRRPVLLPPGHRPAPQEQKLLRRGQGGLPRHEHPALQPLSSAALHSSTRGKEISQRYCFLQLYFSVDIHIYIYSLYYMHLHFNFSFRGPVDLLPAPRGGEWYIYSSGVACTCIEISSSSRISPQCRWSQRTWHPQPRSCLGKGKGGSGFDLSTPNTHTLQLKQGQEKGHFTVEISTARAIRSRIGGNTRVCHSHLLRGGPCR